MFGDPGRLPLAIALVACTGWIVVACEQPQQQPPPQTQPQPEEAQRAQADSAAPPATAQPPQRDVDPKPLAPGQGAAARAGERPNIVVIWGDDIGRSEPQRLQPRRDGLPDPQHRSDRARGPAVHRLLRGAELHGGALGVHHRPERVPDRAEQGRAAGRGARHARRGPDHRRDARSRGLRHRRSSARTTWATGTRCCRPTTASTSSTATSTTSTPRRSRSCRDYPKDPAFPSSARNSVPRGVSTRTASAGG